MKFPIVLALGALLCTPAVAGAQEGLTWNLSLTSDYVFRGVSQTDRNAALQGGLDFAFGDSGFYVGTWGSNVDYGSAAPEAEIDAYVGWNADVSERWNLDLSLTRYSYFGADRGYGSVDYNELVGVLWWNETISFGAAYTDDYANSGTDAAYANLGGEWPIGESHVLTAGIGYSRFDVGGDYTDWNIGIRREFNRANVTLGYHDTDLDEGRASDAVVLTVAFEG